MPTIKTINPNGGGDYTSLSAWESWADDQTSADQWAECQKIGDVVANWPHTLLIKFLSVIS